MNRWTRFLLAGIPVVILGGLLLIFFLNRPGLQPQAVGGEVATGLVQPGAESPDIVEDRRPFSTPEPTMLAYPGPATPTPNPERPVCKFNGHAPSPPTASLLDKFIFSEPQVVLTNTGQINVAGWLPDNQRVLIARMINPEVSNEYAIETFNVRTGGSVGYGTSRRVSGSSPLWLPKAQKVAYRKDAEDIQDELVRVQVQISSGDSEPAEVVADYVGWNFSLTSDQEVAYYDLTRPGRLQLWDETTKRSKTSNMDLTPWLAQDILETYPRGPYSVWEPNGPQVFFNVPFLEGAFLLGHRANGTVCEVSIPGTNSEAPSSVWQAIWSPNGRYLALSIVVQGPGRGRIFYRGLFILDTISGEWDQLDLGIWAINDMAWGPNSRYLSILADLENDGEVRQHLYLVDTFTNETRLMLQEQLVGQGSSNGTLQMDWSKNGKTIAWSCPLVEEGTIRADRLCLIDITIDPKQGE